MHGTFGEVAYSTPSSPPASPDPAPRPLVLEQAPEGGARFVLLALLVPAVVALMAPFWLVLEQLLADPAARAVLTDRPLLGVQLGVGLVMLISIFGWPLAHLVHRSLERRRVTIGGGMVRSDAAGPFRTLSWAEPLAHYAGVAHRVRSSLSGVRHELVLVHRRPSRTLVLASAPVIPQEAVEEAARLFALAEIPSREAASFSPLRGYFRLAEPRPSLVPL